MRKLLVLVLGAFAIVISARPALAAEARDKAVLAALDGWKDAMLKKDIAALDKIFHPEVTYAHSSATVQNKEQAIAGVVKGEGWEAIELADTTVRLQGNGTVAIVNGKCDMHQRNKGKPTTISKLVQLTVWVKGPHGWQMIARQAVRRPDDEQVIAAKAALAAVATKTPAPAPTAPPK